MCFTNAFITEFIETKYLEARRSCSVISTNNYISLILDRYLSLWAVNGIIKLFRLLDAQLLGLLNTQQHGLLVALLHNILFHLLLCVLLGLLVVAKLLRYKLHQQI